MQIEMVIDAVASVSLICGIGVAWWGYHKWDMSRKESRARFLLDLIGKFRGDKDIQSLVYAADYGQGEEDVTEAQKDKTLTYMAFVCYLRKSGVISDVEYGFFEYEITRALKSENVRKYLKFMEGFGRQNGRSPFSELNSLAKTSL